MRDGSITSQIQVPQRATLCLDVPPAKGIHPRQCDLIYRTGMVLSNYRPVRLACVLVMSLQRGQQLPHVGRRFGLERQCLTRPWVGEAEPCGV